MSFGGKLWPAKGGINFCPAYSNVLFRIEDDCARPYLYVASNEDLVLRKDSLNSIVMNENSHFLKGVHETDRYMAFKFIDQDRILQCVYSKSSKKTYLYQLAKRGYSQSRSLFLAPRTPIGVMGDSYISEINPGFLKVMASRFNADSIKVKREKKVLGDKLWNRMLGAKPTDNPVLFVFSFNKEIL